MHKEQERLNVLRLLPRWTQSRAGEIEHPALVAEMNKEYKAPYLYLKKLVYYLLDYLQIKWQKKRAPMINWNEAIARDVVGVATH